MKYFDEKTHTIQNSLGILYADFERMDFTTKPLPTLRSKEQPENEKQLNEPTAKTETLK